ncbi:MAG: hypothetical protein ACYC3L_02945 [Gemmatimonadaceae bacterium]
MNLPSRLLRVALAAAMLQLTLASPARACDQMERAAAPMTHVGHQMPMPKVPVQDHGQQPCCPTMPAGCTSAMCTVSAAESLSLAVLPVVTAVALPHAAYVARWQSVLNAPEPPPPRA